MKLPFLLFFPLFPLWHFQFEERDEAIVQQRPAPAVKILVVASMPEKAVRKFVGRHPTFAQP